MQAAGMGWDHITSQLLGHLYLCRCHTEDEDKENYQEIENIVRFPWIQKKPVIPDFPVRIKYSGSWIPACQA